ncbi:RHS repeat-associated core domain-containing protein [Dyella sp. BiH032]|uniref:RHS repeat-associated core domain-containing protein n=1 Tax=Dyella sp. BiH032 TaxID=3075430 RepID=UPI00289315B7|nr:RHS repeat-associated core domain-containing protein [Dyella sp. BiH032]WNL45330.1 RHS repeat-associated core domain-containing protein [Dyella sp. BiH032]
MNRSLLCWLLLVMAGVALNASADHAPINYFASYNYNQDGTKVRYPTAMSALQAGWGATNGCFPGSNLTLYGVLLGAKIEHVDGYVDGAIWTPYAKEIWCGSNELFEGPAYNLYGPMEQWSSCSSAPGPAGRYAGGPCPTPPGVNPDKSRGAPGGPCVVCGDPINVATGNVFEVKTEYAGSGSFPLQFSWVYNSLGYSGIASPAENVLGANRTANYLKLARVYRVPDGSATSAYLLREDGRTYIADLINGVWVFDADVDGVLTSSQDLSGNYISLTYLNAKGETEVYDAIGHLQSVTDRSGRKQTLNWNDAGQLLSVQDDFGRSLSFTYDSQGRIKILTQPDGGVIGFAYDASNNLQVVTYPDGKAIQYNYGEAANTSGATLPNALTSVIDQGGATYSNTIYDAQGLAIRNYMAGGVSSYAIAYTTVQVSRSKTDVASAVVTDPLGATNSVSFQASLGINRPTQSVAGCTGCISESKSYTFGTNGRVSTSTDGTGAVVASSYESNGLLAQTIEAEGLPSQRTTNTIWDTSLRLPLSRSVLDGGGNLVARTSWVYNATGQVVANCEADSTVAGAVAYVCAVAGAAPAGVRRRTYTYCGSVDGTQCPLVGLLLSVTGPRTDLISTTRYSYYLSTDESGCGTAGGACHRAGDLYQITDAAGHVTTYVAYDKNGRLVRQRDANGVLTDFTYHPRGWLLTRTVRANADGTPSANDAVTQIGYKPYGAVESITDPDGVQVTYTYDAAHRLTDITDALGNRIHYTLDAAGSKTKEETFDTSGTLRRSLGRTYNTLGQLTGIKDGLNRTVFDASFSDSYDGNGNLVRSADALGIQRKQGYDALNRLITTIDNYNGTDTATQNTQSVFAYDARDQLQGVSDPDGLNTTYDYDGLGNTTAVHSPDTGTSTYVYDAAGNRTQATDARGVVSHSTYDALNRITATTYPHSDANVSYRYDEPDSVTGCVGSYPIGRLTSIVETAVTTVYCYDARGNVVKKSQTQGTNVDTVSYTYTLADRLASTRTPDGTSIQYGRDGAGRINAVTVLPPGTSGAGAASVVSNVSYLPFGPIASYTLGNGQTITRTYDANYAVTDVVSPALNLHFARDAMGNVTALGNAAGANPAIETYSYDPLYRLTGLKDAQGQAIEAYTYNKTGDRLSKTGNGLATGTYGYQTGTHWLTSIGNSARTYDANGNTTGSASGGDTFGYGYNDRNRMTVVQRNGQTIANYAYNAMGQRVSKAAVNQRFVYDEYDQLVGEYGAIGRTYVRLGSLPVAVVDMYASGSQISYVHVDSLGSPRAIANSAGATIWQWPYQSNPFGEAAALTAGFEFKLRFPGQYFDQESGLHHNGNRDYVPSTGSYIQSDPIGLSGGMGTYTYVMARPLSLSDEAGLAAETVPVGSPSPIQTAPMPRVTTVPDLGPAANEGMSLEGAASTGLSMCARILTGVALYFHSEPTAECDQPLPPENRNCSGGDDRCKKAIKEAQAAYHDLMTKRLPQFYAGRHLWHAQAILEKQNRLRDAIRRVRLYCNPLPIILSEWERVASIDPLSFM